MKPDFFKKAYWHRGHVPSRENNQSLYLLLELLMLLLPSRLEPQSWLAFTATEIETRVAGLGERHKNGLISRNELMVFYIIHITSTVLAPRGSYSASVVTAHSRDAPCQHMCLSP